MLGGRQVPLGSPFLLLFFLENFKISDKTILWIILILILVLLLFKS